VAVTAATGDLTLSQAINAGSGNVGLTATAGAVTENAGGSVVINSVDVWTRVAWPFRRPATTVETVADNSTGTTTQSFQYWDETAVVVGSVTASSKMHTLSLHDALPIYVAVTAATGDLTLSQAINAGSGNVGLTATAGAVTENAGGSV